MKSKLILLYCFTFVMPFSCIAQGGTLGYAPNAIQAAQLIAIAQSTDSPGHIDVSKRRILRNKQQDNAALVGDNLNVYENRLRETFAPSNKGEWDLEFAKTVRLVLAQTDQTNTQLLTEKIKKLAQILSKHLADKVLTTNEEDSRIAARIAFCLEKHDLTKKSNSMQELYGQLCPIAGSKLAELKQQKATICQDLQLGQENRSPEVKGRKKSAEQKPRYMTPGGSRTPRKKKPAARQHLSESDVQEILQAEKTVTAADQMADQISQRSHMISHAETHSEPEDQFSAQEREKEEKAKLEASRILRQAAAASQNEAKSKQDKEEAEDRALEKLKKEREAEKNLKAESKENVARALAVFKEREKKEALTMQCAPAAKPVRQGARRKLFVDTNVESEDAKPNPETTHSQPIMPKKVRTLASNEEKPTSPKKGKPAAIGRLSMPSFSSNSENKTERK